VAAIVLVLIGAVVLRRRERARIAAHTTLYEAAEVPHV
jgi:hypothetical protein